MTNISQINGQIPVVSGGSIVRIDSMQSEFVIKRHVDIWLPPGYSENPQKRYPVIYFQDGQNLFDDRLSYGGKTWKVDETMTELIQLGKIPACIVVGIWNSPRRFREYMPEEPFYALSDERKDRLVKERGGIPISETYLKFMTKELVPYIDKHYRTIPEKSGRFLAGSSMGGLISMTAQIKFPDMFQAAACISTHWPVSLIENSEEIPLAIVQWMDKTIPNSPNYRMYFDYGMLTLDAWYEPWQLKANEVLNKKGFKSENLRILKFEDGAHNEESWAKRLPGILEYLLHQ